MKLIEVIQRPIQFMTDHDEIEAWLTDVHIDIRNYKIHPNGVVDVDGPVNLSNRILARRTLPVQFGRISGNYDFDVDSCQLTSFAGFPYLVGGNVYAGNNKISSIMGCPSQMYGLFVHNNLIKSLSGIHKHIKHVTSFSCDAHVTNILGLMLINGLQQVNIDNHLYDKAIDEIMNRHILNDRNIHACQEELIEAGFAAQAKL